MEIEGNPNAAPDTLFLIARRRFDLSWIEGQLYIRWEPETEWLKRCAVIRGVKMPEMPRLQRTDDDLLEDRLIISYRDDKNPVMVDGEPAGRLVTLSCGHTFWTPLPVDMSWPSQKCAECVHELVDRIRVRRMRGNRA